MAQLEEKLEKASAKRENKIEEIKQTAVASRARRASSNNFDADAPTGTNE